MNPKLLAVVLLSMMLQAFGADAVPVEAHAAMEKAWLRAAGAENLGMNSRGRVVQIFVDATKGRQHADDFDDDAFQKSLRAFIRTSLTRNAKRTPGELSPGQAHFVAFCILEAAHRRPIDLKDDSDPQPAPAEKIVNLYDGIGAKWKTSILATVPQARRDLWSKQIDTLLASQRPVLQARAEELSEDALFPALKAGLNQRATEKTMSRLLEHVKVPAFDPASEEAFAASVDAFAKQTVPEVLYWVSIGEIEPSLIDNPYFGKCTYSAWASPSAWPIEAQLLPVSLLKKEAEANQP